MKKYKYTNKEERPIPKYKNGDIRMVILLGILMDGLMPHNAV